VPFVDRRDAGRRLAARLDFLRGPGTVVLGLPRGGVVVAAEVALALDAPLDVVVVRKLGVPYQPELALGAIGEGGVRVLEPEVVRRSGVTGQELAEVEERELAVLHARVRALRGDRPPAPLAGRTAVVVDDGLATGSTARAACRLVRALGADRVVLAVPVAPAGLPERLTEPDTADQVVCLETPRRFFAIGRWYRNFDQVEDAEVAALLRQVAPGPEPDPPRPEPHPQRPERDEEVEVAVAGSPRLAGHLVVPPGAAGIVLFAHGTASSRRSPRNQQVASVLTAAGLGVLLFDLLAAEEEQDRARAADVPLLAGRLAAATAWVRGQPDTADARIGYFGASTGAAAALWAAADDPGIAAVVSRGGRPDLAGPRLPAVRAPTLLVVGGEDREVLRLNREARASLRCESALEVVPGASHLFTEPGALDRVAQLARDWFRARLQPASRPPVTAR